MSSSPIAPPAPRVWDKTPVPSLDEIEPLPPPAPRAAERVADLTVIVPAYNEAGSVADTIRSIHRQTLPVAAVVVVDDGSTDGTGDVARACGAQVVRPPANTGSKAGAQNFALAHVRTEFALAIDADTVLAPDAIALLLEAMADPSVAAACGFVLPRYVATLWERGRYVEYLFAFGFLKRIQDYYGKPLIASGCFSAYRTDLLRQQGGGRRGPWPRTWT